jgi:hypothetical protein
MKLSNNHWRLEEFRERVTTKKWKEILLEEGDKIVVGGHLRQLEAKSLGAGIVEVRKKPLDY